MSQGFTKQITVDVDGTLAANSDGIVASQKATKTYVDTSKTAVSNSRILGSTAAGAGSAYSEMTLSNTLDLIGSAAQGDLLYRGASAWARLGTGSVNQMLISGGAAANPSWVTARTQLTTFKIYSVQTTGNDTTGDGTVSFPWLTINKAINVMNATLDTAGQNVSILVGAGTYTTPVVLKPIIGGGTCSIQGAGLASTIISVTSATGIVADGAGPGWDFSNLKLTTITGGNCLLVKNSQVDFASVAFGACGTDHISIGAFGFVTPSSYTINGNCRIHINCGQGGSFNGNSLGTVTLTGTPAWSGQGLVSSLCSTINIQGVTYTGAATGTRYVANRNAVIDTAGGGANYFPGSVAGSVATGGLYV